MNLKLFWIQVQDLTLASIKSRYRKTWAGFLWVIFNPLLMFGVQSLVFKKFLKLDVPDYYLFLLGGLLPWIFISMTIQMGTPLFVTQSQLLRSFKINPFVVLGAQVLDNVINFIAGFVLILLPFYLATDRSMAILVLLPLALVPLLIGTLSLTVILSILNVFYRDINFVLGFVFSILFFLTPVFYPLSLVPEEYRWISVVNPFVYFIEPFRDIMYQGSASMFFAGLLRSLIVSLVFAILALLVWKRNQNEFYRKL